MRLLILGLFAVASMPAAAQNAMSTRDWVIEGCRSQLKNQGRSDPVQAQVCVGGIRSVIVVGQANNEICPPDGATEETAIPIILQYADEHRQVPPDAPPGQTAYAALKAKWPCKP
jgi:hypothetical protein